MSEITISELRQLLRIILTMSMLTSVNLHSGKYNAFGDEYSAMYPYEDEQKCPFVVFA